jgi:uncharacterized lipoprotein YajG
MKKLIQKRMVIVLLSAGFVLSGCQQQRRTQKCDCPQWSSIEVPASSIITHP